MSTNQVLGSAPLHPAPIPFWGRWSLFWTLFIGIGAVAGTLMFWLVPDRMGMRGLLPFMQVLPFSSILFNSTFWPGMFLLVINGLTQLVSAILIVRRNRFAPIAVAVCGVILMGWITLQFVIFPANAYSITYFFFGLAEAIMAVLWIVRGRNVDISPHR